jgi:hypothetical protein
MSGPWTKYGTPWKKYGGTDTTATPEAPQTQPVAQEPTPQTMSQAFNAPSEVLNRGIGEFKSGNVPAGLVDVGINYPLRGLGMPFNVAAAGARQIPGVGETLARTIEIGPKMIEGALYDIPKAIMSPIAKLAPPWLQNLGQGPENAQQTATALEEAGRGASQILGGALVGGLANTPKGLGGVESPSPIVRGLDMAGKKLEESRIAKSAAEIEHAAPPQPKELHYKEAIKRAQPYIAEAIKENPIVRGKEELSPMRQASETVVEAKKNLWKNKIQAQIDRHPEAMINGREVGDAIRESVTEYTKTHEPATAQKVLDFAKTFDTELPLKQANDYIAELNARTSTYQRATPVEKATMETAHPNISAEVAAVEALRDAVYNRLGDFNEKGMAELKKDYGSLIQIQKAIDRNTVKADKQTGMNMGRFGTAPGAAMLGEAGYFAAKHAPGALGVAGTVGLIRDIMIRRGKINPSIKRGFNRLGKTSLAPPSAIEPNFELTEYSSTNKAVDAGKNFTPATARNYLDKYTYNTKTLMEEYKTASMDRKREILYEINKNQMNREAVEGFIAKKLGTQHIPYSDPKLLRSKFEEALKKK